MPTFTVNAFKGGRARSSSGDEGCVASNTEAQLNFITPPEPISIVDSVTAGPPNSLVVTKHIFLVPGVVLQLTHPSDTELSRMVEVTAVSEESSTQSRLTLIRSDAIGVGFVGAAVSLAQNFVRGEVVYGNAAQPLHFGASYVVDGVTYQNVQVPGAKWVGNQWAGYRLCAGGDFDGGGSTPIKGNTGDELIIETDGTVSLLSNLILAIAPSYAAESPFADRVPIWKLTALGPGVTTLLEPSLDLERRGTPLYGHNHMLDSAQGVPLGNTWLPSDVGALITTPNLLDTRGKSAGLSNASKTLSLLLPTPMVVNEHMGKFLNPNQNQSSIFKIVSNGTDSITVDAPMDGVYSPGEVAYVIGPRVAVKYVRALAQLRSQVVNPDARVHILFTS